MAVQPRFCGRCGSQVAPGAAFCGRCGAPQFAQAVAPPAYRYQTAPPSAVPARGGMKMSQLAIGVALILILAIATVAISAFAVSKVLNGTHSTCTANCGAKIVVPLPAASTYHSTAFKFDVDYNPNWAVRNEDANGVSFGTRLGRLDVVGMKSGQPLDQLIQSTVSALPTSTWQNVAQVSDLKGAHIGGQDGLGFVFSADLIGSNATATKVRFVVIDATHAGVTVVIFAVDPENTKNFPNGIPEGRDFDYLLQEFRWA
jgi:zinc ribbon protein